MVAVPTHFFKVVLAERQAVLGGEAGSQPAAVLGAWVLPNAPLQPDTPLTAFSVPLESLEEAAGGRVVAWSALLTSSRAVWKPDRAWCAAQACSSSLNS